MSASTISLLNVIGQEITIYSGILTLIAGLIGGFLNTIVFLSLQTFRENSCATYLTVMSIANLGRLLAGLLNRVIVVGFNIDWTQTSLIYCKLRLYCVEVCELTSFSCVFLATMDQYFATCSRPHWQRWSNIKLARRLSAIIVLVWLLYSLPYPLNYNQIRSTDTGSVVCTSTDAAFLTYHNYVNVLGLGKVLPAILTVSFGLAAYLNVKHAARRTLPLVRRELDKQLTMMVLVQCLVCVCTIILYVPMNLLTLLPIYTKGSVTDFGLQLGFNITACIYYLNFASPFYIYFWVSNRFRRQLKYVIFDIYVNRFRPREVMLNQIAPQLT